MTVSAAAPAVQFGTTANPRKMGIDCGFDIYPPLERTNANQEQYELFLREVLVI
jgi:hypothetical protein